MLDSSTAAYTPQMKEAVVNALAKCGNMSVEEATATVIDWQIKGKYNVEVW